MEKAHIIKHLQPQNVKEELIIQLLLDLPHKILTEFIQKDLQLSWQFKDINLEYFDFNLLCLKLKVEFFKNNNFKQYLINQWCDFNKDLLLEIEKKNIEEIKKDWHNLIICYGQRRLFWAFMLDDREDINKLVSEIISTSYHEELTLNTEEQIIELKNRIRFILLKKDERINFLNKKINNLFKIISEKNKEIEKSQFVKENFVKTERNLTQEIEENKNIRNQLKKTIEEKNDLDAKLKETIAANINKIKEYENQISQLKKEIETLSTQSLFNIRKYWLDWLKNEVNKELTLLKEMKGEERVDLIKKLQKLVEIEEFSLEIFGLKNISSLKNQILAIISKEEADKFTNLEKKYKTTIGKIIFDINGGIIKTGDEIISLSHQELSRSKAKIDEQVEIAYDSTKKDMAGRYIGKIVKRFLEEEKKIEIKKEFYSSEIATIAELPPIPKITLTETLEKLKIKYKLEEDKFIFEDTIKNIAKMLKMNIEVFEICNDNICKQYCIDEGLVYKEGKEGNCDICGKFIGTLIDKIAYKKEIIQNNIKVVLIGGSNKFKHFHINEFKKIGVDIWWHDAIYQLNKIDRLIQNCDFVTFIFPEKYYNTYKKAEMACKNFNKKLIKINYFGFSKIKNYIMEEIKQYSKNG